MKARATNWSREHRVAGFPMQRPLNRLALLGRPSNNTKQVTRACSR